jgi:hypothetical protein
LFPNLAAEGDPLHVHRHRTRPGPARLPHCCLPSAREGRDFIRRRGGAARQQGSPTDGRWVKLKVTGVLAAPSPVLWSSCGRTRSRSRRGPTPSLTVAGRRRVPHVRLVRRHASAAIPLVVPRRGARSDVNRVTGSA